MSIIHGGVTIRDFDMPPAFERREHHEEIGRAVALVFVIEPGWPPLFHPDRSAGFGNQLLRGLIQANQRNTGIARSRVHGQHVFHGRHERAVGLRRDDPLLFQMRLENVFLKSARSCCRWRDRQCSVRRPCSLTTAMSSARGPWGARNKPERSVWLPSRRRKSGER